MNRFSQRSLMMFGLNAIISGFLGASALTLIHEGARRAGSDAPRLDLLGMRAIDRSLRSMGLAPPTGAELHRTALAGDLFFNTLYYALVGAGRPEQAIVRGAVLGLAAGVGAVVLPGLLGLGSGPSRRTSATVIMTMGWYLAGGLAAAYANRALLGRTDHT
jgi:hypothetical protein